MALGPVTSGTLGSYNAGLSAAIGFLVPLGAQIDALIAAGLGPFKADVGARLNAALSAQAGLAISVGNPFASLQVLLSALGTLAAALQGALAFGIPSVEIGAQLSLVAAISGSLAITLGGLELAIKLALAVKIPALRAAANITASLSAGPAFAFSYSGPLATVGNEIAAEYNAGMSHGGNSIAPGDSVYGVTLLSSIPSVQLALQAIIQVS